MDDKEINLDKIGSKAENTSVSMASVVIAIIACKEKKVALFL